MDSKRIRESFLQFFKERGHTVVPSSPLIPAGDPTLFFTNAGMVQFKRVFTGDDKVPYVRAVSSQKCLRVSGKHNDLENVGRTARHHTFFEMLGNFSFGDYFKEAAIRFAVDFLTSRLKLDRDRFYITIYEEDDEAFRIWKEVEHFPEERIIRMGKEDNFWAMGDTGPCGPCSEIVFDQGNGVGCGRPECNIHCGCDRFLELWNLVFMQFMRDQEGRLTPLPMPSIDTGMGLERITAIVQKKKSNYDTDLFSPLIEQVERISGKCYGKDEENDISMRVIADHSRATTFLISEGVFPSNEERGYVLRRLMRRGMRHGMKLGIETPFLFKVAEKVVEIMKSAYPELIKGVDIILETIEREEIRFKETLKAGLNILEQEISSLKKEGGVALSGEVVFRLYDTYGFPKDLTESIAAEKGISIDEKGFEKEMEEQRRRARGGASIKKKEEVFSYLSKKGWTTRFTGYEKLVDEGEILLIIRDGIEVEESLEGERVHIILDKTPFYGESGGQVGDRGIIEGKGGKVRVEDTIKVGEVTLHSCTVDEGKIWRGMRISAKVDSTRRLWTRRNHTATHLLHHTLKVVLGSHVNQKGSLVEPERLRFDFTHFSPLSDIELRKVEIMVNERVMENLPVEKFIMKREEALKRGAIALFGEKYGDMVRVVKIGDISMELCGGTHLDRTGDIGIFRIKGQAGVAAGIRRIEAVTGVKALEFTLEREEALLLSAKTLKVEPENLLHKIQTLIKERKELERTIESLRSRLLKGEGSGVDFDDVREIKGIKVIVKKMTGLSKREMGRLIDTLKGRISKGVILLLSDNDGSILISCGVTEGLTSILDAGLLAREVAKILGGGGGGRPDFAEAGGKDSSRMDEAVDRFYEMVGEALKD